MEETKQTTTPEELKAKPRGISLYDVDVHDLERWAQQKQKTRRRGKVYVSEIVQDLIEERRKKEQGKK